MSKLTGLDEETQGKIADAIIALLRDAGQWAMVGIQDDVPHDHEDGRAVITVVWTGHREES